MKFSEAMKALEEGKPVRRADWPAKSYVTVAKYNSLDTIVHVNGNPHFGWFEAKHEDLLKDWELCEEDIHIKKEKADNDKWSLNNFPEFRNQLKKIFSDLDEL